VSSQPTDKQIQKAYAMAKERYAQGDISREEFEQIKKDLF